MSVLEKMSGAIPEYYSTMYKDGFTPEQILNAAHNIFYERIQDNSAVNEIVLTVKTEVK